jgi:tetratricopeptide (TPR) repeat protein
VPRRSDRFAAMLFAGVLGFARGALAQGYGGTVTDILVRGDSLLSQKRYEEAIVQFQEARTLCPTPGESVHSFQGEAEGQAANGALLPAAGLLEEAAGRFPEDPRVPDMLYQAATLRLKAGQAEESVALLRRALDAKPTPDVLPTLKFTLAQALRARGKPAEVVDLLKDFQKDFPDHPLLPAVLYTLAIAQHDVGNYARAQEIYLEILKRYAGPNINQAYKEAHFELAAVLREEGRAREAADYYRRYVSLVPESPLAGAALERAGDCLLLRSPSQSAELYALARVKAAVNGAPPIPGLGLSRFIGAKQALAALLSRTWLVALLVLALVGAAAGIGLRFLRRRAADPARA